MIEHEAERVWQLGDTGKFKAGNEPALSSLRDGVLQWFDLQAIPEAPPQEEPKSNMCMENGAQFIKDVSRVHELAPEIKIQ